MTQTIFAILLCAIGIFCGFLSTLIENKNIKKYATIISAFVVLVACIFLFGAILLENNPMEIIDNSPTSTPLSITTTISEENNKVSIITPTETYELQFTFTPAKRIISTSTTNILDRPTYGLSPEQVITEYYKLINERNYEVTWLFLTNHYKNKFNNKGYQDYVNWWNTVKKADIIRVYIRDNNISSVVVYTLAHYIFYNGYETDDQHLFTLLINEHSDWLIDDQGG